MPHLRRYSPQVNRWVCLYSDVMLYITGINTATQEVMALGADFFY